MKRKRIGLLMILIIAGLMFAGGCGDVSAATGSKVSISRKNLTITEGSTKQLKLRNAKADKVKWKSSNKQAATVSSRGKVKGMAEGDAVITATYKKKTYKCNVTVKKAESNTYENKNDLKVLLGSTEVSVNWEDNNTVKELKNLAADKPLKIKMSMYGGFEQVGSIGKSLTRNDKQMTTEPGDIVLYSGNQIVVFYGSNTWSYTKLGHISNKSSSELKELLGNGDITLTFTEI